MNFFRRIYTFDYMGHKKWWFTISAIVIAAGLISLFAKGGGNPVEGLNYGLEFKEGTRIAVAFEKLPTLGGGARDGRPRPATPTRRSSRRPTSPAAAQAGFQIQTPRAHAGGAGEAQGGSRTTPSRIAQSSGSEIFTLETVGATFGRQVVSSSLKAVASPCCSSSSTSRFRFQWKFAVGAIAAEIHDLLIVIGVYSLTGREVTTATIAAVLTILGYSLYDTVIVYDRIRENEPQAQPHALRRHGQRLHLGDAHALHQHHDDRAAAGRLPAALRRRARSRTSPSRCSSASSRAPTRRSSWPARSSRCSRSASRSTASSRPRRAPTRPDAPLAPDPSGPARTSRALRSQRASTALEVGGASFRLPQRLTREPPNTPARDALQPARRDLASRHASRAGGRVHRDAGRRSRRPPAAALDYQGEVPMVRSAVASPASRSRPRRGCASPRRRRRRQASGPGARGRVRSRHGARDRPLPAPHARAAVPPGAPRDRSRARRRSSTRASSPSWCGSCATSGQRRGARCWCGRRGRCARVLALVGLPNVVPGLRVGRGGGGRARSAGRCR